MKKSEQGFTLIELLLTIAIISILAGTILVSVGSHKQRAQEAKMQTTLAGAIQNMVLCRSDDGDINEPNTGAGGGDICSLSSNYGQWPAVASSGFGVYTSDAVFEDGDWFVYTDDGTARICCNSGSNECHHLATGAACDKDTP